MPQKFGVFDFDSDSGELRKNGRAVALEPQPAKALTLLLSRAGEIVSREELRDAVWGQDTHVDFDRGLAYCISQVRTALGDSGENPRFVQTIPKKGFKFIAPIATDSSAPNASSATPPTSAEATVGKQADSAKAFWFAAQTLAAVAIVAGLVWAVRGGNDPSRVVIGVSVFDNETGLTEHDRMVAGLSDVVVERLTRLDAERIAVIGNAAVLRQPRNIRNLNAVAQALQADYVLLGQLQRGESGFRFITHFIRLSDQAHLKANRLTVPGGGIDGLEAAVVEEFERAVREHVLNRAAN